MLSNGEMCDALGNHEEAVEWYQKAADLGLPAAMHNLAVSKEEAEGTPCDMHSAIAWYNRAADAGFGKSMLNLAFIYYQGGGHVARDKGKSLEFTRRAADAGETKACRRMVISLSWNI